MYNATRSWLTFFFMGAVVAQTQAFRPTTARPVAAVARRAAPACAVPMPMTMSSIDLHQQQPTPLPSPSAPCGLLDPDVISLIRAKAGPNDPVLSQFFDDFLEGGPMVAMRHLGTPGVTSRLAKLFSELPSSPESPRTPHGGSLPLGGWGRR